MLPCTGAQFDCWPSRVYWTVGFYSASKGRSSRKCSGWSTGPAPTSEGQPWICLAFVRVTVLFLWCDKILAFSSTLWEHLCMSVLTCLSGYVLGASHTCHGLWMKLLKMQFDDILEVDKMGRFSRDHKEK